jgi:pyruvate,water dikinase
MPVAAFDRARVGTAVPLPGVFRLTAAGAPVAVRGDEAGRGAGGGRATGVVVHADGAPPPAGSVLVVRTLDPSLAPLLSRLGGLIAETGSVLSHLAILARESGVPTVVGVDDALRRFPPGSTVFVDGTTGEVGVLEVAA